MEGMLRQREPDDGGNDQVSEQTDRGKVQAKGAD